MDEFSIDSSFQTFDIGYYRLKRYILFPNPFYEIFCFLFFYQIDANRQFNCYIFSIKYAKFMKQKFNQIESK